MRFTVLTLFPPLVESFFQTSIVAKAVEKGVISYRIVDIREYGFSQEHGKPGRCDDTPYGGGGGMLLRVEPLSLALDAVGAKEKRTLFPTPSGRLFTQEKAAALSVEEEIVLICGRYEGVDQRVIDEYVDDEVSLGDYVIASGELASLVIIDSVCRLCDGVLAKRSLEEESFKDSLLEYPHYTRPPVYRGRSVPEVLLSGDHGKIARWRLEKSKERTARYRPDLLLGCRGAHTPQEEEQL